MLKWEWNADYAGIKWVVNQDEEEKQPWYGGWCLDIMRGYDIVGCVYCIIHVCIYIYIYTAYICASTGACGHFSNDPLFISYSRWFEPWIFHHDSHHGLHHLHWIQRVSLCRVANLHDEFNQYSSWQPVMYTTSWICIPRFLSWMIINDYEPIDFSSQALPEICTFLLQWIIWSMGSQPIPTPVPSSRATPLARCCSRDEPQAFFMGF